jgi:hypothetical protein
MELPDFFQMSRSISYLRSIPDCMLFRWQRSTKCTSARKAASPQTEARLLWQLK